MATKEFTREQFYDLIWLTPISILTKQYALSYDGFRKLCKKHEVPMHEGGYWMKLKFNKKINKPRLNPILGKENKILLPIREAGTQINVDQTPLTIRTKEIESDTKAPLTVPDKISKPDILTIQTKEYWTGTAPIQFYRENGKITYPIHVSKNCQERALRFMDIFTKLIRYRGHTLAIKYSHIGVVIEDVFIEIELREASKRVPAKTPFTSTELHPIGELIFKIGKYYPVTQWRDGKTKIEEKLAKILAKMEIEAAIEKERIEKARIGQIKRQEEENRLAEIRKHKEIEASKFNRLVALSEQYQKSLLIRQYIEAELQSAISTNSLTPEKQEWIKWATDKADSVDPVFNKLADNSEPK